MTFSRSTSAPLSPSFGLTEGIFVEGNLSLGHRHCMVDSTLPSQTNLQAAVALFYRTLIPAKATGGVTQKY